MISIFYDQSLHMILEHLNFKKMKKSFTIGKLKVITAVAAVTVFSVVLMSSSHREAPMIANDPLADNTDLYAFKSPTNPDKIVIIANYIPGQLPNGEPSIKK